MRTFSLLLASGFALAAAPAPSPAPTPPLNQKVAEYCKSQMGEKVGEGECAHLASAALKHADAKGRGKDSPNDGDYVWGELVFVLDKTSAAANKGKIADLKPGDIIQYRDTKWGGPNRTTGRGTYSASAAHHTSVIRAVEEKGKVVKIWEQNSGGKRYVIESTLYLDDLKEGWIRVYRPVAK